MKTAIVIINYNGLNLIKKFMPSIITNSSNCNIYVIDNGEVVDSGKHDLLLLKSDLYKNFYEKQIQK